VTLFKYEQQQSKANSILESTAAKYPVASVVRVAKALCNVDVCPWTIHHEFLYYDAGHLSEAGALRVYPVLAVDMRTLLDRGSH
jgi:hypothetical protein